MAYEKWHKFYLMKFENKFYPTPPGYEFIKPGTTYHMDVIKRFDPAYDSYAKNYDDWIITCKYSRLFKSEAEAKAYETYFLTEVYPYDYNGTKVWLESVLGLEDKKYYNTMSGRSEIRMIPISEAKKLYSTLNEEKKSGNYQQKPSYRVIDLRSNLPMSSAIHQDYMMGDWKAKELQDDDNAMTWSR